MMSKDDIILSQEKKIKELRNENISLRKRIEDAVAMCKLKPFVNDLEDVQKLLMEGLKNG